MDSIAIDVSYVKGWFDRGSHVNVRDRAIVAGSSSGQPIRAISAFLRRNGVHCTLIRLRDRYELRVSTRIALEAWKDQIGFSCEDKAAKLDSILGSYKS